MTASFFALTCAFGVACIVWWALFPERHRRTRHSQLQELLYEAGLSNVTPTRLIAACCCTSLVVFLGVLTMSESRVISAALAAIVAPLPIALVKRMQRKRQEELRSVWPDAIEHLASAVRAGLSLPEAINQLAEGGPLALQPPFRSFQREYRVSGRFNDGLDVLKQALADPVGDRVVESIRVARDVGGSDLGHLLRATAGFLRDDARVRGELESRQSWTVNAARLAVAAPWVLLLLLATRPAAVTAYNSPAGVLVLAIGAGVSVIAYRLMMRLGRLPVETRVLR